VRKEAQKIQPAAVGLFPGAVNFGKLSFVDKMFFQAKEFPKATTAIGPLSKPGLPLSVRCSL